MTRRKIAIFGGSFDPVHVGHLVLASYVAQFCDVDEVWISLSPANPLKGERRMADDSDRRRMLELAVGVSDRVKVCDIELAMPRPSYTIDTLCRLRELFPDCDFRLLIGSDNYLAFDRWREGERIKREFGLIVYPRPGYPVPCEDDVHADFVDAPVMEISSSFIRQSLSEQKDMNFFLVPAVYEYIKAHKLYTSYDGSEDSK